MSGNFSEVIEGLDILLIDLDKKFASSFRKYPDRLSGPAAFETLVAFKIMSIVFSESCQIKMITLDHMLIIFNDNVDRVFIGSFGKQFYKQKQPSRGVLIKRCSENMQQIYRRTSIFKSDFNNVAKQLY